MRVVFAATLIAALQLASAMPAAASGIASYAQTQASSPVQVVGCSAGLEHINSGFGTDFYRLNMFAQFKNESS